MIQIANFTKKFFIELVKQLQIYGTLYVTEDGNMYVNEKQAQDRCKSREKLAHLNAEDVQELRYARIDKVCPPGNAQIFEQMLESQFRARRQAAKLAAAQAEAEASKPLMSDEEAEAILNGLNATTEKAEKEPEENIIEVFGDTYPFEAVRDAIKAVVNPKLHSNTGFEKTLAAYEALTDEDKNAVAVELKK